LEAFVFSFNKFKLKRQRQKAIALAYAEIFLESLIFVGEGEAIYGLQGYRIITFKNKKRRRRV